MIVYCATTNSGKLREMRDAGGGVCEFLPLPGIERIETPEETGTSFAENAIQKAQCYGAHCEGLLAAEDSGIVVDALDGAPGIRSARFAGPGASDQANNFHLLERMKGRQDRRARFVSVIALVNQGRLLRTFQGEVEGLLLDAPAGSQGFGYDPLFYFPPFGRSFGEVTAAEKQSVSHRGRALQLLVTYLAREQSWNSEPPNAS